MIQACSKVGAVLRKMSEIVSGNFELIEDGAANRLILNGDVTIQSSAALKSALLKLDNQKDLVVESQNLSYIDSSGIACLVLAYKTLVASGAKIRLIAPSQALMHVLQTLKFDTLFVIES